MRMARALFVPLALFPLMALAQTKTAPPWPDIRFSACPPIGVPVTPTQLTWKHGEAEQADWLAVSRATGPKEGAALLAAFVDKYPDSYYREEALFLELVAQGYLKDVTGIIHQAKALIELPMAQAARRVAGYVTLDTFLSPSVAVSDPDKGRKAADLERWTQCGIAAVAAQVRPENMQAEAFEKSRQYSQNILHRTLGFVAFLRKDFGTAVPELEKAAQFNPQDALTYLWLGDAKLLSPSPDFDSGIFYLARWVELSPQVPGAVDYLKQAYVIVHGSDKDLPKVRNLARMDATPPPGFTVLAPPKKEPHYGTAVAAAAIIGLMVYGAVSCPDCFAGSDGVTTSSGLSNPKTMIFGGPDHRTYLGCLSCSQEAPDSVFNEYGRNGRRDSPDSIWNQYGQYGSPYSSFSACNEYATDPPVIVDQNGKAYGRVTVNQYASDLGAGAQLYQWLVSTVCAN